MTDPLDAVTRAIAAAFPESADAMLDEIERWFRVRRGAPGDGRPCLLCESAAATRFPVVPPRTDRWLFPIEESVPQPRRAPWARTAEELEAPVVCVECLLALELRADERFPGVERMLADASRAAREAGDSSDALEAAFTGTAPLRFAAIGCALCRERAEGWSSPAGAGGLCRACAGAMTHETLVDRFTGAATRARFFVRAPALAARARRTGRPASIAFGDLDWLKHYNDLHGHTAGDDALLETVRILAAGLGRQQELFRFGGEELLVIAPMDPAGTGRLVERLRAAIDERRFPAGRGDRRLTISFGVAPLAPPWEASLRAAEEALLRAKRGGRNRVELAGPEVGPRSRP